ncbi:MAG TPA: LysM peptidoglycan-binding domain-containing protein [Chloroflexi bacterium]|nr:LysM peptidoglycan-binding domain-containing protein [Chloroflexota bacterium]
MEAKARVTRFRWTVGVFAVLALWSGGCRRGEGPAASLETPVVEAQVSVSPVAVAPGDSFPQTALPTATFQPTALPSPTVQLPLPTQTAEPWQEYTVAPGDTLLAIALRFGVPMAAIQLENDMGATTVVRQGDQLRIPPAAKWEGIPVYWILYEVGSGETLSMIANRYALTVDTLLAANHLADPDLLQPGQLLVLPLLTLATLEQPTAPVRTPTAEPTVVTPVPSPSPAVESPADEVPVSTVTPIPTAAPPVADDLTALAQRVFALINEQRAQHGLGPLAWNDILARAAQRHAEDCYARGWCDHVGSDGATYKERIIREGYDPVRWSECWAWYGTPELAVAMWMDEVPPNDPHRRTILSSYLTEVGVGVMPANGHGYYFIADFGTPRE